MQTSMLFFTDELAEAKTHKVKREILQKNVELTMDELASVAGGGDMNKTEETFPPVNGRFGRTFVMGSGMDLLASEKIKKTQEENQRKPENEGYSYNFGQSPEGRPSVPYGWGEDPR